MIGSPSVSLRSPELFVPPAGAESHFDTVSSFIEASFRQLGADGAIYDPTISMLERPWYVDDEKDAGANRRVIIEAVSSLPDALAAGEAISRVTNTYTSQLAIAGADILQDVAKPSKLSRQSQSHEDWQVNQRIAMMVHVLLAKQMVELSALPTFYRGDPFRQLVADALGEHHGRQPNPSFIYGCGHLLGGEGRRVRDAVSCSDWFGAKFYRENRGNEDELGMPLPDEVRSRQFGAYLLYFFGGEGGYWNVNERNNPYQVALAVYEAIRNNHPHRLADPRQVFDGSLEPLQQSNPYVNVVRLDFSRPLTIEDLALAA